MRELKEIGETLNYNGYGNQESDLTVHPKDVYLDIQKYKSPFQYKKLSEIYNKINTQMKSDETELNSSEILHTSKTGNIILLPTQKHLLDTRIYSNKQTTDNPSKAFAILTNINEDTYRISIRSPKNNPVGASKLALSFPTSGGREKDLVKINELPKTELKNFIEKFEYIYGNE